MNAKRTSTRRSYDVVLYGATGFVGRQKVERYVAVPAAPIAGSILENLCAHDAGWRQRECMARGLDR